MYRVAANEQWETSLGTIGFLKRNGSVTSSLQGPHLHRFQSQQPQTVRSFVSLCTKQKRIKNISGRTLEIFTCFHFAPSSHNRIHGYIFQLLRVSHTFHSDRLIILKIASCQYLKCQEITARHRRAVLNNDEQYDDHSSIK